MAFVKKRFFVSEPKKAFLFLMHEFGVSQSYAQKMIDKGHIIKDGVPQKDKAGVVYGEIEVVLFEPDSNPLEPVFETPDFAVFDKPHDMPSHPKKKDNSISLLDSARALFGANSNCIHRLDSQTSGLIMVSKNKKSEIELKKLFELRKVKKEYLALVFGEIKSETTISAPILQNSDYSDIKLKVLIDVRGKEATTIIKPLQNFYGYTLVKALPLSGRQHQIRVHLNHIGHRIVGEHIYGVAIEKTIAYLDGKLDEQSKRELFGASRLMLHSNHLSFEYGSKYEIYSKAEFQRLAELQASFSKPPTSPAS